MSVDGDDVLVAIPAHDEVATITGCLTSVCAALEHGRAVGAVRRARVALALHRCTDDTEQLARAVLADRPEIEAVLWRQSDPMPVGTLRTRLVEHALRRPPAYSDGWIFSTDADSTVPLDWVEAGVAQGRAVGADLLLGMVDLVAWDADAEAQTAYARIVEAGMTGTGHRHAYAANLAVRIDAFRRVGGFPGLPHGEEHGLAAAVRAAGLTVLSTLAPRVQTSARMPGRASDGLGSLLAELAHHD